MLILPKAKNKEKESNQTYKENINKEYSNVQDMKENRNWDLKKDTESFTDCVHRNEMNIYNNRTGVYNWIINCWTPMASSQNMILLTSHIDPKI